MSGRRTDGLCARSGKLAFRTKRKAIRGAAATGAKTGLTLYTYFCESCGHWHLTKSKP